MKEVPPSKKMSSQQEKMKTSSNIRPKPETAKYGCKLCTVILLSACVAALGILLAVVLKTYNDNRREEEVFIKLRLGEEGIELFKSYDRDGDGVISMLEFEPLIEKLLVEETMASPIDFTLAAEDIDPSEEVLTIEAFFQPLLKETMTKEKEKAFSSTHYDKSLEGLDEWKEPFEKIVAVPVGHFKNFLPDELLPVGEPYTIIKSNLNMFSSTLSSNRYYPPKLKGKEQIIHRLLSMFHQRPFVHTRFGPQGTIAVIRAENEAFVEIIFRIHGEFQLNQPPLHPFWFSPAQFTGNIIMSRDGSHVRHFHLYVPNNRSLNVDMEWLNGPSESQNMEVDIGYMPQMELTVSGPSTQVVMYGENGEVLFQPDKGQRDQYGGRIVWNNEITEEEARRLLEIKFYPFKKVPYLSFQEAFSIAEAEKKLVHSILLWGSLDDQSC